MMLNRFFITVILAVRLGHLWLVSWLGSTVEKVENFKSFRYKIAFKQKYL